MKLNLKNILMNFIMIMIVSTLTQSVHGSDPLTVGLVAFAATTGPAIAFPNMLNFSNLVMGTILTEVWTADIKEKLFANNDFLSQSTNHNAFVSKKTVNIPQSGSSPNVVKNRTALPATISQRTDTIKTYDLDSYTTDPILIEDVEEIQISYNKRQSILQQHVNTINDRIALETIVNWAAPASKVVKTTGGTSLFQPTGSTGSRKKLTIADLAEMKRVLMNDDFSSNGWNLMMTHDMYSELITDSDNRALNKDFMNNGNLATGAVNMIHGFNIFLRSTVAIYDSADTVKAVGAASATGDSFAAIAWHVDAVAQATGSIKVFAKEDDPTLYGSVFDALVLHGSTIMREDFAGVGAIVQETV